MTTILTLRAVIASAGSEVHVFSPEEIGDMKGDFHVITILPNADLPGGAMFLGHGLSAAGEPIRNGGHSAIIRWISEQTGLSVEDIMKYQPMGSFIKIKDGTISIHPYNSFHSSYCNGVHAVSDVHSIVGRGTLDGPNQKIILDRYADLFPNHEIIFNPSIYSNKDPGLRLTGGLIANPNIGRHIRDANNRRRNRLKEKDLKLVDIVIPDSPSGPPTGNGSPGNSQNPARCGRRIDPASSYSLGLPGAEILMGRLGRDCPPELAQNLAEIQYQYTPGFVTSALSGMSAFWERTTDGWYDTFGFADPFTVMSQFGTITANTANNILDGRQPWDEERPPAVIQDLPPGGIY